MRFIALILALFIFSAPALAQDGAPTTLMFHGFPCADDCSEHRAGFDWAAEKEITEESGCGSESQSFTEGCIAYVRSLTEEHGDEAEMDEEYYEESATDDPVSP